MLPRFETEALYNPEMGNTRDIIYANLCQNLKWLFVYFFYWRRQSRDMFIFSAEFL